MSRVLLLGGLKGRGNSGLSGRLRHARRCFNARGEFGLGNKRRITSLDRFKNAKSKRADTKVSEAELHVP